MNCLLTLYNPFTSTLTVSPLHLFSPWKWKHDISRKRKQVVKSEKVRGLWGGNWSKLGAVYMEAGLARLPSQPAKRDEFALRLYANFAPPAGMTLRA